MTSHAVTVGHSLTAKQRAISFNPAAGACRREVIRLGTAETGTGHRRGLSQVIEWAPAAQPHLAVAGEGGTGKTALLSAIAGEAAAGGMIPATAAADPSLPAVPCAARWPCASCAREIISAAHAALIARISGRAGDAAPMLLIFDEFSQLNRELPFRSLAQIDDILTFGGAARVHLVMGIRRYDPFPRPLAGPSGVARIQFPSAAAQLPDKRNRFIYAPAPSALARGIAMKGVVHGVSAPLQAAA